MCLRITYILRLHELELFACVIEATFAIAFLCLTLTSWKNALERVENKSGLPKQNSIYIKLLRQIQ